MILKMIKKFVNYQNKFKKIAYYLKIKKKFTYL